MTNEENIEKLNFKYIIVNIFHYVNDSLFYAFIIQIILVSYGYFKIGKKNIYWKILYYSSWFGLIGAIIEKLGKVWTEHPDNTNEYVYLLYAINEPFWIISEYTIPYINMVKLSRTMISKPKIIILKIYIAIFFILFVIFRIRIGILRYKEKEVFNNKIYRAHGYAFMTLAIAEFSCTVLLIRKLSFDFKIAKRKGHDGNIYEYSKKSSFFILLVVDICGFILAILSLISNYTVESFLEVFHCIKSNFVLILAVDALIFKIKTYEGKEQNLNTKNFTSNISSNNVSSNIFNSTNINFNDQNVNKNNNNVEIVQPCNMECINIFPYDDNDEDIKKPSNRLVKDVSSSNSYKIKVKNELSNIYVIEENENENSHSKELLKDDNNNINIYQERYYSFGHDNNYDYNPQNPQNNIKNGKVNQIEPTYQIKQKDSLEQIEQIISIEQAEQTNQDEEADQDEQIDQDKQMEQLDQDEQMEQMDQVEQIEEMEKIESMEQLKQIESTKQIEQVDQIEQSNQIKQLEQKDSLEQMEQIISIEQTEQTNQDEQIDQDKQMEQIDQDEQIEQMDQVEQKGEMEKIESIEQLKQIESTKQVEQVDQIE